MEPDGHVSLITSGWSLLTLCASVSENRMPATVNSPPGLVQPTGTGGEHRRDFPLHPGRSSDDRSETNVYIDEAHRLAHLVETSSDYVEPGLDLDEANSYLAEYRLKSMWSEHTGGGGQQGLNNAQRISCHNFFATPSHPCSQEACQVCEHVTQQPLQQTRHENMLTARVPS